MSAADDSPARPQPTAHEVEPGCTLSRRDALKTAAFTAAALAGGTASSGTVSASSGLKEGVASAVAGAASDPNFAYAVSTFGPAGLTSLAAYHMLRDDVNREPSSDAAILHNLCESEVQSLGAHEVTFGNRLNDARPVANLEARHGIASEWENGSGSSTAYDTALQRIRQHYETPEFNHLHVTNKSLLQLSYIAGAAEPLLESGEIYENFNAYITSAGTASDDNNYQFQLTDRRQSVDWTLHDGTPISEVNEDEKDDVLGDQYDAATLEVPIVDVWDVTNETVVDSFSVISPGLFDTWDPDAETVTVTFDGGTTMDWDYTFTIPSNADADQESIRVFDGREFCEILSRIHGDSDTVTGNYTVSFVEDLYAELDAGNITPDQVRSPEGMVHFLSGTDDPTNERFRVSMYQQFGMEQPDFSLISGMKVDWSGATDTTVDTDPNVDGRRTYPSGHVLNETYDGVLFGNEIPGGFDTGNEYVVGTPFYAPDSDGVSCLDPDDGTENWRFEDVSGAVQCAHVNLQANQLLVGDDAGTLTAIDLSSAEAMWTYSTGDTSTINGIESSADGSIVFGGSNSSSDGVFALDAETGDLEYGNGIDSVEGLAFDADRNTLYAIYSNTTGVAAHDPDDLTQKWHYSTSFTPDDIAVDLDGESVFTCSLSAGSVVAVDTGDQTEAWSYGTGADSLTYSEEHDAVFTVGDQAIVRLDAETGSSDWHESKSVYFNSVSVIPGFPDELYCGTGENAVVVYDPETGSKLSELGTAGQPIPEVVSHGQRRIDGYSDRAMIFDNDSGQVDLWNGVVTVTEMYDADGAQIDHVTDQTITDLENAVGKDIETIVSEVDGYDDQTDIEYTRDVMAILEHYEETGEIDDAETEAENITIENPDWERPDYDTFDSTEFAKQINELETYLEQLEAEQEDDSGDDSEDDGLGIGLPFDLNGDAGAFLGVGVIAVVVLAVVGFVTDLIPGLGN